ncbi:MAG: methylmalonyl-CoA mutase family protein [Planctomycetota bacterium]
MNVANPARDTEAMTTSPESIFPPATLAEWRAGVERDLAGAPFEKRLVTRLIEGIALQPLHSGDSTDRAGMPGLAPFTRGSHATPRGTAIASRIAHPDLAVARRMVLRELEGGATTLVLPLDLCGADGMDADDDEARELVGQGGLPLCTAADLRALLDGVDLTSVAVRLQPGAAFLPAAAMLATQWTAAPAAGSGFGADPIGTLATALSLPGPLAESLARLSDLAAWTATHRPGVTTMLVGGAPWHDAGAHRVQELGWMLSTGVAYLRALTAAGMTIDAAAQQVAFAPVVDAAFAPSLAMLRALRRTWSRVLEASGATPCATQLHAVTSSRMAAAVDPWTNLLRNTLAALAAICGGADSVEVAPHDATINLPDDFSSRIARNTAIVLQEESHAGRVLDPAGGSWFIEQLTDDIAREAWAAFQTVEADGGIASALLAGKIAAQIMPVRATREADVATRKTPLIGVNEFAALNEATIEHEDPDFEEHAAASRARAAAGRRAASAAETALADCRRLSTAPDSPAGELTTAAIAAAAAGATIGTLYHATSTRAEPATLPEPWLLPMRLSAAWEQLRDRSDDHLADTGSRPQLFLANLGPLPVHSARAGFARGLAEAAGIECIEPPTGADSADTAAAAFAASGARAACICSSDDVYATLAAPVATALRAAGAACILLAGKPGEHESAWRAAGVHTFIFIGCNAADVASHLLDALIED